MLDKEENKGGIYNQLKNNEVKPIKWTKEAITKALEDIFYNPNRKDECEEVSKSYGWTHNEWKEGDRYYSSWTFKGAGGTFTTGDKGKEEFDKLFAEQFKEESKIIKDGE